MNTKSSKHNLTRFLDTLSEKEIAILLELLQLNQMVERNSNGEDNNKNDAESPERLIKNLSTDHSKGYIEEKMINGCGPYKYLRYRQDGKLKSKYIGKGHKNI